MGLYPFHTSVGYNLVHTKYPDKICQNQTIIKTKKQWRK